MFTAQHEPDLLELIFAHCSESIFGVCAKTLTIMTANARLAALTGHQHGDLVGAGAQLLFARDDGIARRIIGRPGLHEHVALACAEGHAVYVDLTVAHAEQDNSLVAVCVARDSTEKFFLERELLAKHTALFAAHSELENVVSELESRNTELGERNRELAFMGSQLSEATRRALIGELSAGVAHSLNNPLAALASTHRRILLEIELHGCNDLTESVRRFARRTSDVLQRMEQNIKSIQRAHRSGMASMEGRLVDVDDEVDVALSLFESRLTSVTVHRDYASQDQAWIAPGDLQHVLWNLLGNAIAAMDGHGELRVTTSSSAEKVTIIVHDSGPGVADHMRPVLFEPFETSRPTGSGLGLSTARRLARQWGGDVELVSSDSGARFRVNISTKEKECNENES